MASTYSSLKIQLMATGENSGTWGNVTNDNLGVAIEEAIAESADVSFTGSNVTISLTDTNASQTARNLRLNLTGTGLGATTALTVPDIEKPYIVNNGLSDDVEVKNSTGSNVTVPAGKTMWVYSTGSNVVDVTTHVTSLTLGTPLAVAQGGTGQNLSTGSGAVVLATSPTLVTPSLGNATATQIDITAQGTLRLQDTTGGEYIALRAPGTVTSNTTFTLPDGDGSSGDAIITDGSGNLSFGAAGISTGKAIAMAIVFG